MTWHKNRREVESRLLCLFFFQNGRAGW